MYRDLTLRRRWGDTMHDRIIGWRTDGAPIYRLSGSDDVSGISFLIGDDSDGADDVDDDADDEEPDDDAGHGDTGMVDPEEYRRLQDAVRAVTAQSAHRKRLLQKAGLSPQTGKPRPGGGGGGQGDGQGDDRAEALAAARAEAAKEERYVRALTRTELKARLQAAGWTGSDLGLVSRLIDPDEIDVEVGDDGEVVVTGLDEQIDKIRTDVPGWFRKRRQRDAADATPKERVGAAEVDGGGRPAPAVTPKGWRQRMSDQLGSGRRG